MIKKISQEDNFFSTSWLGVGDIHNPFKPQISSWPCVQEVYVRNSVADRGFPREMKKIGSLRGGVPLNPPIKLMSPSSLVTLGQWNYNFSLTFLYVLILKTLELIAFFTENRKEYVTPISTSTKIPLSFICIN